MLASNELAGFDRFNNAGYNKVYENKMGIHTHIQRQSCRNKVVGVGVGGEWGLVGDPFVMQSISNFGCDTKFWHSPKIK